MKLEFIIPTYDRVHHLMAIISSIFSQTNPNWFIHVIADCPPKGTLDKVMNFYKDSKKIKFTILNKRYNDWGHTPRNIGLQMANEEWLLKIGIIAYMNKVKPPYNISIVTQELALTALEEVGQVNDMIMHLVDMRNALAVVIESMPYVEKVYPSDTNFLLVKIQRSMNKRNMKFVLIQNYQRKNKKQKYQNFYFH
jgi:glycosyltransferase involved in cell wall biosynthesis